MEHDSTQTGDQSEPERLTLSQIFGLVLHGWRVIATLTAVCFVIAVFIGMTSTRLYRTYYVVMQAPTTDDPLRQSGISLDVLGRQSRSPDWQMYLSLLTSTTLAERLATKTPIMHRLFAGQWDASKKRWITRADFWSLGPFGKVKWLFGQRTVKAPDKFALRGYLAGSLNVQPVGDTSQIMISIDGATPDTALMILTYLHQTANDMVREARLSRVIGQRTHLLSELQSTTVADYRETILNILGRVETSVMTASVGGQYAAVLVDGPVTMPDPVYPKTGVLAKFSVVGGVVFGLILVVFFPVNDATLISLWRIMRSTATKLISRIRSVRRTDAGKNSILK